jgi:hypothetical protein
MTVAELIAALEKVENKELDSRSSAGSRGWLPLRCCRRHRRRASVSGRDRMTVADLIKALEAVENKSLNVVLRRPR